MQQSDCSQLYTPRRRQLASISLFAYNFLMNISISTIFGIKIDIDNQKKMYSFRKSSKIWALDRS